jgi:hypothetical protein
MKKLFFIGLMGLVSLCFFLSCDGGGGDEDPIPSPTAYTYASGGYVMTITLKNQSSSSGSMKSIYSGGDFITGARAVLSMGETAAYTLKYDRTVKSTGEVLMGEDTTATFIPASGKPAFIGTFAGETGLNIAAAITLDDGLTITLSAMKQTTGQEAAFAEYWGIWHATISGRPVTLIVGDGVWELQINGQFDSEGIYTQTSPTTADIFAVSGPSPYPKVGYVQTYAGGSMTIVLNDKGPYPGNYQLTR